LRSPDLGCESLPGLGCLTAKNVVYVGAVEEAARPILVRAWSPEMDGICPTGSTTAPLTSPNRER